MGACLEAIFSQSVAPALEVIIIDSGSADDSITIAKRFNTRIISIDPATFNHGETRNLGVAHASGNLVYLTVQDARLADSGALERMAAHFSDNSVMAVCGNQGAPHEKDKNPVDWYRAVSKPGIEKLHFDTPQSFNNLPPAQKVNICGWDDVNAMYRKSVLLSLPFKKCDFGEDMLWCKEALQRGLTLLRDTGIVTWHYHFATYPYQLQLRITTGYLQYREFGYVPAIPSQFQRLKFIIAKLLKAKQTGFVKKIGWFFHNINILKADIDAARRLQKAIKSGGVDAVKQLYQENSGGMLMGRLKGQQALYNHLTEAKREKQ